MKILVGNLKSKLVTDNPKVIQAFYDKYAYHVPGYQYIRSYKQRVWDGKKRYFSKAGAFRTGILPRILEDLKIVGCENPEIVIEGNLPNHLYSATPISVQDISKFAYRDYQRDAIKEVLARRRLIVESPTGSGKTLIMAGILKTLSDLKATILFREKGILNQTYEFLKSCGIKNLGINSGDGYIPGKVMLSTVQSIDKIIDEHLNDDILMVDEAHQFCKGDITVAAIEAFPRAFFRIAFTATVPSEKDDIHGRLTLEGAFGSVYSTRSMGDLIKDGHIANPIIQIVNWTASSVDSDIGYQDQYETHIIHSKERNNLILKIVDLIRSNNKDCKILILVKNLEHLNILKSSIVGSLSVEGKDSINDRYEVISEFLQTEKSCIIGTNVMQTGININEITHMINARGLTGEIPTIQGLGRGVRKSEGKDKLYFYDFIDNVPYLYEHSMNRISHYKKLQFEIHYVKLN